MGKHWDGSRVALYAATALTPRLDGALRTLGWWKMSLLMAGGLEPDDLYGPFQPKPFCDSMIRSQVLGEISSASLFCGCLQRRSNGEVMLPLVPTLGLSESGHQSLTAGKDNPEGWEHPGSMGVLWAPWEQPRCTSVRA